MTSGEPEDGETQDPEKFAEEAGLDPTPQEVEEYQELAKKHAPWSEPD
jgi:hypothetical protein